MLYLSYILLFCGSATVSSNDFEIFVMIRGSEWGGPHVGCQLKFPYFVGCRLEISTFVGCR